MINYKSLLVKNSVNYSEVKKGLDFVGEYAKKNKLILVGGLAIDFALRAKGDSIYDEYEVPDYDLYSPDNYQDAINIGKALCEMGLKNISIIRGFHISTMRVRVNFEPVADITYCPPVLYKNLPFITYENMRVIAPSFQLIDQHNAMAYPYRNPQWGGNITRWKKDIVRQELLKKYYPIPEGGLCAGQQNEYTFDTGTFADTCIGGYLAHALMAADYSIDKNKLTAKMFKPEVVLYSSDFIDTVRIFEKKLKVRASYYNAYLTQTPRYATMVSDNIRYIIFDNHGDYLACTKIDDMNVASANAVMVYYLQIGEFEGYKLVNKLKLEYHFPIDFYGQTNEPETFDFSFKLFDDPSMSNLVPKNLYPKKDNCDVSGEFAYDSIYFQVDGQLTQS